MGCTSSPPPGSPEYDKPYKPENNSGCCGGCKCKKTSEKKTPEIKKGCYIRYNGSCKRC